MLRGLLLGAVLTAAIGLSLQPSKGVEAWGYKIMLGVLFATGTACWASFGTLFVYPAPQTVALYFVGFGLFAVSKFKEDTGIAQALCTR